MSRDSQMRRDRMHDSSGVFALDRQSLIAVIDRADEPARTRLHDVYI